MGGCRAPPHNWPRASEGGYHVHVACRVFAVVCSCWFALGCSLDRGALAPGPGDGGRIEIDAYVSRVDAFMEERDAGMPDAARPDAQMDGCIASAETCDGRDQDCDGLIDEALSQACLSLCGEGTETCAMGAWVGCDAPTPATEECNGLDDDCDSRVDEMVERACMTACGMGVEVCAAGSWGMCSAPVPGVESCNGLDDDCDSNIDEMVTRACTSMCGAGIETCAAGAWGACSAAMPTTETCNGVDDDCDSSTDEMLSRACTSACGAGTQTCAAGAWGVCTSGATEICNGLDDDCNGVIDDGATCATTGCQPRRSGGRTYLFCTTNATWTAARDACRAVGYQLVTIVSDAEDDYVVMTALGLEDADWWIGLSDIAMEGTFVWASGSSASYRRWGSGQPNNFSNQDCGTIADGSALETRGRWNDDDCGNSFPYVCEAP